MAGAGTNVSVKTAAGELKSCRRLRNGRFFQRPAGTSFRIVQEILREKSVYPTAGKRFLMKANQTLFLL